MRGDHVEDAGGRRLGSWRGVITTTTTTTTTEACWIGETTLIPGRC